MKKNIIKLIVPLILLLVFIVGFYIYKQTNSLILQGEIDVKTVNLSSKLSARINKINIKKGDFVKKGEILAELDTPEVQAKAQQSDAMIEMAMAQQLKANNGERKEKIAIAKANYEAASKTYARMKNLNKEGVVPAQKLDEVTAVYQTAKETYEMLVTGARDEDKLSATAAVHRAKGAKAEVNAYLKENKIVSPVDGVVTEIIAEEGELAGAGFPVITIVDNNDCWATFSIREDLLAKIKNGTEFYANIPAIGKNPIKFKVNYISVMGNFATWRATKAKGEFDMKTFEVRAVPVEKTENLRAGMSVLFDWKKLK